MSNKQLTTLITAIYSDDPMGRDIGDCFKRALNIVNKVDELYGKTDIEKWIEEMKSQQKESKDSCFRAVDLINEMRSSSREEIERIAENPKKAPRHTYKFSFLRACDMRITGFSYVDISPTEKGVVLISDEKFENDSLLRELRGNYMKDPTDTSNKYRILGVSEKSIIEPR